MCFVEDEAASKEAKEAEEAAVWSSSGGGWGGSSWGGWGGSSGGGWGGSSWDSESWAPRPIGAAEEPFEAIHICHSWILHLLIVLHGLQFGSGCILS